MTQAKSLFILLGYFGFLSFFVYMFSRVKSTLSLSPKSYTHYQEIRETSTSPIKCVFLIVISK